LAEYAAATATGACRARNEDSFAILSEWNVFLIVDGQGPDAAGLTVAGFTSAFTQEPARTDPGLPGADSLARAVLLAHGDLHRTMLTEQSSRGQGAALAAAWVSQGWIRTAHVGDCRLGRVREGKLEWLTQDHSLEAAMRLSGDPPEEIARLRETHANVITRAVGASKDLVVDLAYHPTAPEDVYVLCSDGLTRHVSFARIARRAAATERSLTERCADLLEATEAAGGADNATVLLLRIRR